MSQSNAVSLNSNFGHFGREPKPYKSFLANLFHLEDYDPREYEQEPGSAHLHTHNLWLSPGCLFILRAFPLSTDAMEPSQLLGDAEVEWLSANLMQLSRYEMTQKLGDAHEEARPFTHHPPRLHATCTPIHAMPSHLLFE